MICMSISVLLTAPVPRKFDRTTSYPEQQNVNLSDHINRKINLFQIQIIFTLSTGKSNYVIDLTTIRLASLNQTLDPWLYILLRKSFIRKLCSYLRRCCSIKLSCYEQSHIACMGHLTLYQSHPVELPSGTDFQQHPVNLQQADRSCCLI
jgi:hypothetical protein